MNQDFDKSNQKKKFDEQEYRVSSKCETSACVGVKILPTGAILVTNTSDKKAKPIAFTKEEWQAFTAGVKNNEFDV